MNVFVAYRVCEKQIVVLVKICSKIVFVNICLKFLNRTLIEPNTLKYSETLLTIVFNINFTFELKKSRKFGTGW